MTTKNSSLPPLSSIHKIHIVGVCGTLMGAFAAFLKRKGIEVTGSDQNVYPPMSDVLREAGVEVFSGFSAENLKKGKKPDLVVIGNVIRSDNPEARAAIDGGFSYSSLPEAMEHLFLKETQNLVVAGTHGKTTTSSLLSYILVKTQKKPNYFIGGVSPDLPFSFQVTNTSAGNYFVLEGDEYDTAFWDKVPKFNHYLPDDVILTSVEFDHADIYSDLNAVIKAFEGLVSRVRAGGKIIACYDYATVQSLVKKSKVEVISYGSSAQTQARYTPGKIRVEAGITHFEVLDQGKKVDEISMQLPGMHNVLNALAVWIECQCLKLDAAQVREAFKSFQGVKRRQEVRGEINGITIIDDFAHHPTAVRETLRALKSKYPGRRLVTVFEPRSATSRRKIFQNDYVEAFKEADVIFVSSPYDQSRIDPNNQFSSETLVNDLIKLGKKAFLMATVDEGVGQVSQESHKKDVLAILSNGGFGGFIPKVLNALQGGHPTEGSMKINF